MKNILILALIADAVFAANPKIEEYFKTSDGETFYKEVDAKAHARSLKDKTVEKVTKQVAEADADEDESPKLTAADVIALIAAAETLEALEPYKDDARATVKKALEQKTKALTEAANQNPE